MAFGRDRGVAMSLLTLVRHWEQGLATRRKGRTPVVFPAWGAAILAAVATERDPPAWRVAILAAGGRRWNGDHTLGGGDCGAGRFGVLEIGRKLQKRLRISKSPYLQVAKAIQIYWDLLGTDPGATLQGAPDPLKGSHEIR